MKKFWLVLAVLFLVKFHVDETGTRVGLGSPFQVPFDSLSATCLLYDFNNINLICKVFYKARKSVFPTWNISSNQSTIVNEAAVIIALFQIGQSELASNCLRTMTCGEMIAAAKSP